MENRQNAMLLCLSARPWARRTKVERSGGDGSFLEFSTLLFGRASDASARIHRSPT